MNAQVVHTQTMTHIPSHLFLLASTPCDAPSTPEKASVMPDRDGTELQGCDSEGGLLSTEVRPPPNPEAAAVTPPVFVREQARSSVSWDSWCLAASRMGNRSRDTSRKGS